MGGDQKGARSLYQNYKLKNMEFQFPHIWLEARTNVRGHLKRTAERDVMEKGTSK